MSIHRNILLKTGRVVRASFVQRTDGSVKVTSASGDFTITVQEYANVSGNPRAAKRHEALVRQANGRIRSIIAKTPQKAFAKAVKKFWA